jgi:trk system potassium uptake protein TrkA
LSLFGHDEPLPSRVVIAGGGNVGLQVAQQIEQRFPAIRTKLIEISRERALDAAEALDRTVVLHGSALDQALQREADIDSADLMISLSNDDQVNVLSAMMAKRLGAKRSLCLINNRSYQDFTSGLGIDAYVNPRAVTVSRVLQHVRRGRIRAVYSLMDGEAEIIEAEALSTSSLVGRPLREIDFSDGVRVGAVLRQGRTMFPRGDTVIMAGDRVVLFAKREYLKTIEQMFRVSLEFF